MKQDRNFDELAHRFKRNIYGSLKGKIRLAVLKRDFEAHIPGIRFLPIDSGINASMEKSIHVLDVGAGQGHFSRELSQLGCSIVLNDLSEKMLALAKEKFDAMERVNTLPAHTRYVHCPLQEIHRHLNQKFDIILCHAVMEWLAEPEKLLDYLLPLLKESGFLSVIFYNHHGLAFKNLLRTNFHKFDRKNFKAHKGSLTPTRPQDPEVVAKMLTDNGMTICCRSGIRVFHDYILDREQRERAPEQLIEKELEYSTLDPYWKLARYVHLLARR